MFSSRYLRQNIPSEIKKKKSKMKETAENSNFVSIYKKVLT